MTSNLKSDLIEILKGTMKADMGIYKSGSIKVKDTDKQNKANEALKALNQLNLDEDRKKVKNELRMAGGNLFRPPPNEDIRDGEWKKWSLETNLASCCFSIVFPNLAIGLCEWCDPANPKKNDQSPERLYALNQILSLWAIYDLALAYKDTKSGADRTEEGLRKITEPNPKLYPDFQENKKNKKEIFKIATAALQWPSLIQLCEIHKDRQEKTRFEERKKTLLKLLDPKLNCNKEENEEECKIGDCILFPTMQKSTKDLIGTYKSYIAGSLFLLCQEYQILSMRANCRKNDKIEDKDKTGYKVKLIEVQGNRVCEAIKYINTDSNDSPLKCLNNKLYLIALMYIHEALQSIDDATSGGEEDKKDFDTKKIETLFKEVALFVSNFENQPDKAERLFPEQFEWWPNIIKIMISAVRKCGKPKALIKKLTQKDSKPEVVEWIKKKLLKLSLGRANKPIGPDNDDNAVKAIRDKICDESMKLKDSDDPETEKQLKTYREVIGRFNDLMQYKDDDIKKWEIRLINDFLGCNRDKTEKSNTLDRWSMAQLCARRRFLEKGCYQNNNCRVRENGVDNGGSESQLHPIIKKLFNKTEPENKGVSLSDKYLDNVIKKSRDDFKERLSYNSRHKNMEQRFGIVCLRRWQSYTPVLSAPQKVSRGGGYFVFKCDCKGKVEKGVVIDPGLYFLENFIEEGFSIQDIDAVMLTHSHIDHRDDLESILTLLHEAAKKKAPKNIRIVVTQGAWDDIGSMIRRSREHIDDIYTVEDEETKKDNKNKDHEPNNKNNGRLIPNIADPINIKWEKAYHECFDADCVGYRLWIENKTSGKGFRFTGDTVYPANGLEIFGGEDVVMVNLGGLVSDKKDTKNKEYKLQDIAVMTDEKIKEWALETGFLESHLYLAGALQLFYDWQESLINGDKTGLAVLCELPEELSGGHRKIIAKAIQEAINGSVKPKDKTQNAETTQKENSNGDGKESGNSTKIIVLPEDVGLRISYYAPDPKEGPQIECLYCSQHVKPEEIEVIPWGLEERLMFVCRDCRKAAEPYLLEEKFKNYRDRGRPFEKAES